MAQRFFHSLNHTRMNKPIFITGIGTGIGKTVTAAIVTEALQADYWKPVQAGDDDGTDKLRVKDLLSNTSSVLHKEAYYLHMPASPHIAAKAENIVIDLENIVAAYKQIANANKPLVIEGAGGLLVPLNEKEFIFDLIKKLNASVLLVSRNYLGSINHSLLTAQVCKANNINVIGWIFNDQYLNYEEEIVEWSGYQKIASIPFTEKLDKQFIQQQAAAINKQLLL